MGLETICHNTLVTINDKITKDNSTLKYNILGNLESIKSICMNESGSLNDAENKYRLLCLVLKTIDSTNDVIKNIESYENWVDQYMSNWKENKEGK